LNLVIKTLSKRGRTKGSERKKKKRTKKKLLREGKPPGTKAVNSKREILKTRELQGRKAWKTKARTGAIRGKTLFRNCKSTIGEETHARESPRAVKKKKERRGS